MPKLAKRTVLAAALVAAGISFPSFASAQTLEFDLQNGQPRVKLGENRDRYRNEDRYRDNQDEYVERRCSPERALDKADRLGVDRARIVSVGRRTIQVGGRMDGDRVLVAFGRSSNCPVLSGL